MHRLVTIALAALASAAAVAAEPAAARYAPAQLALGHQLLERAQEAAASGDTRLAGRLAWQAGLDARLAWGMTESEELRAEAAELGGAARALVRRLASDGAR